MIVLGFSGLYHDSAAALLEDGYIIAAAQEERFTRNKNDDSFPVQAIKYCLEYRNIELQDVDAVVYYDNPVITLERYLKNALYCGKDSKELMDFQHGTMFEKRLVVDSLLEHYFGRIGKRGKLLVANHHMSHAASAFFPSPYDEAAILTIDGVGEWNTTTIGYGKQNKIKLLKKIDYPHSLGMLYSAFTLYCGFKVNSGEYKLMGLAPYGKPVYYGRIMEQLIDVKEDGSFRLNLNYFDFQYGRSMINHKFEELFQMPRRKPESNITKFYMDIAASVQRVTEDVVIRLAKSAAKCTGYNKNLVLAGGIALNCVANGKLKKENIFKNVWVQPAAGDAGGSIGAAYLGYYDYLQQADVEKEKNRFHYTYLGPAYSNFDIESFLRRNKIVYHSVEGKRAEILAELLQKDYIIGLFQGRMEFGPRALGNRSIIANAKSAEMQSKINLKIKFRESFRPFAPAVLLEEAGNYFDLDGESPYMLFCAQVNKDLCHDFDVEEALRDNNGDMIAVSRMQRSDIPAVTHVDFSARVQTVSEESNRNFYNIIKEYYKLSGCPVIVNTSFNVRGEPVVCTPQEAYICFMRTDMDVLCMEDYILYKSEQKAFRDDIKWEERYQLD